MARRYKVPYQVSCVAAITELVNATVASGMFARFIGFTLNDVDGGAGLPASQQLVVKAALFITPTPGSALNLVTAVPDDAGDSGASTVCNKGPGTLTTGAEGAGQGYLGGCYITQGLSVVFPQPIPALETQTFCLQLTAACNATITLAGDLIFEEEGGV